MCILRDYVPVDVFQQAKSSLPGETGSVSTGEGRPGLQGTQKTMKTFHTSHTKLCFYSVQEARDSTGGKPPLIILFESSFSAVSKDSGQKARGHLAESGST